MLLCTLRTIGLEFKMIFEIREPDISSGWVCQARASLKHDLDEIETSVKITNQRWPSP